MCFESNVSDSYVFPSYNRISGREVVSPYCIDKMTVGQFLSSLFKTCLQKQINSPQQLFGLVELY